MLAATVVTELAVFSVSLLLLLLSVVVLEFAMADRILFSQELLGKT
jgi:hypothetical protein